MKRSATIKKVKMPQLPPLQASSPMGAWLTRHLFKVVAALLLLLALLLAWILDSYGFELGLEGLTRTDSAQHTMVLIRPHSDPTITRR